MMRANIIAVAVCAWAGAATAQVYTGTVTLHQGAGTGRALTSQAVGADEDKLRACLASAPRTHGWRGMCKVPFVVDLTPTWTHIADEGEAFEVPANSQVRYGANDVFVTRVFSGAGQCTNGAFGGDPLREVVKRCEVSNIPAPPVPAPAPEPSPSPAPAPAPAPWQDGGVPAGDATLRVTWRGEPGADAYLVVLSPESRPNQSAASYPHRHQARGSALVVPGVEAGEYFARVVTTIGGVHVGASHEFRVQAR